MYESFFGLAERPFDLAPNPRFLFLTGTQREALSNLRYGLTTPRGLTLLLGEAGTGKTTLVQAALSDLAPDAVECVLLSNPTLTRAEFYEFLSKAFQLEPDTAASKTRFLFALRKHLEERHRKGRLSALVIDEAQSVPYELLEEVRLLSNIETQTTKLLNVVLAGQPELADRLNETGLRQLKQRISLRCELRILDFRETAAYIAGRLRIAGGNPAAIMSREAVAAIHEASRGVPRTINVVADNALLGGFAAQIKPVTRALVRDVVRDFDLASANGDGSDQARTEPTEAAPAEAKPAAEAPEIPERPAATSIERASASGERTASGEGPQIFGVYSRRRPFSFF